MNIHKTIVGVAGAALLLGAAACADEPAPEPNGPSYRFANGEVVRCAQYTFAYDVEYLMSRIVGEDHDISLVVASETMAASVQGIENDQVSDDEIREAAKAYATCNGRYAKEDSK